MTDVMDSGFDASVFSSPPTELPLPKIKQAVPECVAPKTPQNDPTKAAKIDDYPPTLTRKVWNSAMSFMTGAFFTNQKTPVATPAPSSSSSSSSSSPSDDDDDDETTLVAELSTTPIKAHSVAAKTLVDTSVSVVSPKTLAPCTLASETMPKTAAAAAAAATVLKNSVRVEDIELDSLKEVLVCHLSITQLLFKIEGGGGGEKNAEFQNNYAKVSIFFRI